MWLRPGYLARLGGIVVACAIAIVAMPSLAFAMDEALRGYACEVSAGFTEIRDEPACAGPDELARPDLARPDALDPASAAPLCGESGTSSVATDFLRDPVRASLDNTLDGSCNAPDALLAALVNPGDQHPQAPSERFAPDAVLPPGVPAPRAMVAATAWTPARGMTAASGHARSVDRPPIA